MYIQEFKDLKQIVDKNYEYVNCYEYGDAIFYIEPNFYTQLEYLKEHFAKEYNDLINTILDIAKRNKKVIFTADFENPVVYKDGFIYREISDVLAENKLVFDNKSNPESDWKD